MSKYGDDYDNEKKLQRCLKMEQEKNRRTLVEQAFDLLDHAIYGKPLSGKIYVYDKEMTKITNLQRILLKFGYTWSGDGDNRVRFRISRMWINPKNRTMNAAREHEALTWRDPETVTVGEIMNLNSYQGTPAPIDTKALEQYISVAVTDRLIWMKRREEQIRELQVLSIEVSRCKTEGQLRALWQEAKRIRGTYGASQTNS